SISVATNPIQIAMPESLTATVSGAAGIPTGTVTFMYTTPQSGPATLGTATLNSSGIATINGVIFGSLASRTIWAVYNGDTNYAGSTSDTTTVTVVPLTTTVTLNSNSANPSTVGSTVNFTVSTTGIPNGATVRLKDADNGNAVIASIFIINN